MAPERTPRYPTVVFAALAVLVLLVTGVGFRLSGIARRAPISDTPLARSLDEFPHDFLGYEWSKNQPLDDTTERVLGATAYLNRVGFRPWDASRQALWVCYYGQSETKVQHEPEICYRANGWSLPFGIGEAEIVIPARNGRPSWKLPVNVYLFRQDVNWMMLVNTYCVNGYYTNDRDRVRNMGKAGQGFYTQVRVSRRLSDFEYLAMLSMEGGSRDDPYAVARDTKAVARRLRALREARQAAGDGRTDERHHPYLLQAEILQYVVPELEPYLPEVTGTVPTGDSTDAP